MTKTLCSDNIQKPISEMPQDKDAYRAPRLVPLGTAVSLVQGGAGTPFDSSNGIYRMFARP